VKNVKKLAVGIDSITSKMELDGFQTLDDADVGPVLTLVPPLAMALVNGNQWNRVLSGSVSYVLLAMLT
jgi:hypothetical protein